MRIKLLLSLFLLCSLSVATTAYAANYYASPTGTGNGSSINNPGPFETGRNNLSNIDTLYLLSGQYDFSAKVTISKSGTVDRNKVIAAYPGQNPIFDFRDQPYGKEVTGSDNVGVSISSGTVYVHIKGITIRYAGKAGLINQGSYCTIENCVVYGCGDTGIQMKNGGNNLIKNCDSYDNFDYKTLSNGTANYGGNADGFADKQHEGAANTYIGCRAWNNSDDGWDFYERIGTGSTLIDCICYNNGPATYNMNNNPRAIGVDKSWFDDLEGTQVVDRHGETRTIKIDEYINLGNGNGFKVGGNKTSNNVKLQRCLAVGNTVRGFDHNNNAGEMVLYNCSAYDNGWNYGFSNVSNSSLIIKNCVSLASQSKDFFNTPSLVTSHNSWNTSGIVCDKNDFISLNKELIVEPRNADGSLSETDFMRLVAGSDLIDAGVTVALPYGGTAPDLGCYETGIIDKYPGEVISPSNKDQTIELGETIENIVFKWLGDITGLTVSGLPQGLGSTLDVNAKTLTIYGTTTAQSGTYTYTVSTVGGSGSDMVTGEIAILPSFIPSETKYYTIYSYGKNAASATTAKMTDTKMFMTASNGSILLVEGTSDNSEQTSGTPDPLRKQPDAQWEVQSLGNGQYAIKNRISGTYLQVGASLSGTAVNLVPEYKKEDNGKQGFAILTSEKDKCIQINNLSINAFNGYADRTRMRWIIEEAEDKNPSNVMEETTHPQVSVYPNPTTDWVYLDDEAELRVYTLQGVLLEKSIGKQVDLSAYPQGTYLLQVNGYSVKIIKK